MEHLPAWFAAWSTTLWVPQLRMDSVAEKAAKGGSWRSAARRCGTIDCSSSVGAGVGSRVSWTPAAAVARTGQLDPGRYGYTCGGFMHRHTAVRDLGRAAATGAQVVQSLPYDPTKGLVPAAVAAS